MKSLHNDSVVFRSVDVDRCTNYFWKAKVMYNDSTLIQPGPLSFDNGVCSTNSTSNECHWWTCPSTPEHHAQFELSRYER